MAKTPKFMVYFSAFIRCQDGDHNHLRTKHQVSTNYVFEAFQDCVCSGVTSRGGYPVPLLPAEARWLG